MKMSDEILNEMITSVNDRNEMPWWILQDNGFFSNVYHHYLPRISDATAFTPKTKQHN